MSGTLDKPQEWLHLEHTLHGPTVWRVTLSWREMLDLMTRWAACQCIGKSATLWRKSRGGWVCEGGA